MTPPSPLSCWRAAEAAHSFWDYRMRFEGAVAALGDDPRPSEVGMALYYSIGWLEALDAVAELLPELGAAPFEIDREPEPARLLMTPIPAAELDGEVESLRSLAKRVEMSLTIVHERISSEASPRAAQAFELSARVRRSTARAQWDSQIDELGRELGAPTELGVGLRAALADSSADAKSLTINSYDAWASAHLE